MKEIIFLNPPKKRKTTKTNKTRMKKARKKTVRRAVRRNAPKNVAARRSTRKTTAVAKRKPTRRKATARRRPTTTTVTRTVRRKVKRNPPFNVKSIFSQDVIGIASGVVGGRVLSEAVIGTGFVQSNIPANFRTGANIALRLIIPAVLSAAAYKTTKNKMVRSAATGMVIGGVANALGALVSYVQGQVGNNVQGTGEYFGGLYAKPRAVSQVKSTGATPSYQASTRFKGVNSLYDGERAFSKDPWN